VKAYLLWGVTLLTIRRGTHMSYVRSKMRSLGMKGKRHKGLLREVAAVIRFGTSIFDHDRVLYVCANCGVAAQLSSEP
jgi:hypothetical protein